MQVYDEQVVQIKSEVDEEVDEEVEQDEVE